MKALMVAIVTLAILGFSAAEIAEAKRLGGGRSAGKSFTTTPFKRQQATSPTGQQGAAATQGRRGLMGGMLGGLLAGGLFAWLLGSGAFEGIQLMDILLLAGVAYLLFRLFRSMNRAKAATQGHQAAYAGPPAYPEAPSQAPNPTRIGGENGGVPFNFPPDFQLDSFLEEARQHYRTLQEAWNKNDLQTIREYFEPSLYEELKSERLALDGEQHTQVMYVDAELGRADHGAAHAQVSLIFSGRYRDEVEGVEEDIRDIWHLERDLSQPGAPWLIVGIESPEADS